MLIKPQRVKQLIDIQRVVRQISAHLDIFLYIQIGNQVVHLKHISQVLSAVLCELFLAHILQLVAIYADISGIGAVDASDDIEQCGLS